jgi:hypothetical protein
VQLRKPDEPYVVLERVETNARERTLFVITPKDQAIRIGRGSHTDIKLNDLTLSRTHAKIEFKDGQFILSDLSSKFGTLLLLQSKQTFSKSLCLQLANRIYKLEVIASHRQRALTSL